MDFTKLGFAAILACLFISGGYIFWAGMSANYSGLNEAQVYMGNTTNITKALNVTLFNAQVKAQQTPGTDDPLGVLMGYFGGAFDTINVMVSLPTTFLTMIGVVFESMGAFSPSVFIMPFVSLAVGMITVIGLLYYLTKVK
jgi:hypothetical protein